MERDDDDDARMGEAFRVLRRHIVRVSADFGARLAVRLLAAATARLQGDPRLLEVFTRTFMEGATLMLEPLASAGGEPTSEPPADAPDDDSGDDSDDA